MSKDKFTCSDCGFTYGKHWQTIEGICEDCHEYHRDISRGIDPDNERTCRGCAGSGCNKCDGCGEVKRGGYNQW